MMNPFGMDESCPNCPPLVEARSRVVHGFGDVLAEFLFVKEAPSAEADAGAPPLGHHRGYGLDTVLDRLGFLDGSADPPTLTSAFVTHLTRCRHPDRPATDTEINTCEPFLNAEIRSINPEILVPIGQRALEHIAKEYTTEQPDALDAFEVHAQEIRGRGFELVPMVAESDLTEERFETFIEAMEQTLSRDYRQTKGRQGR